MLPNGFVQGKFKINKKEIMEEKITAEDMIKSLGLKKKPKFSLYVVRCFKIKARSIKKSIWSYVFQLAKEADKVKNFITR